MNKERIYIPGFHSVAALIQKNPDSIACLYIEQYSKNPRVKELIKHAQGLKIKYLSPQEMETFHIHAHQGIIAECYPPEQLGEKDIDSLLDKSSQPLLLILDGVTDPHNLGACLRTADAVGVTCVITPKDRAVGLTPVVYKSSSGAALNVPFIQVTNLSRVMRDLKKRGIWFYGADEEGSTELHQCQFAKSAAIVLGAEGEGLRRLTKENCDELIRIPMLGSVSSLNVSVATGVILFEVIRQKSVDSKKP